ncbi:MAG TPA: MgtC/SapB family protein [Candidatus Angelobacter sp.]
MTHVLLTFFPQLLDLVPETLLRLIVAATLGGLIGLERQVKHRPAGLRTNMLMCFGAALFTVLSIQLAGGSGGERTRIASQIIAGIGFIGAGSILRDKGGVTGVTTAATIFVVASIGMACGGGFYLLAVFSTALILLALLLLGWLEQRFNLKPVAMNYTIVTGKTSEEIVNEVNEIVDDCGAMLRGTRLSTHDGKVKIVFNLDATRTEHKVLAEHFRRSPDLHEFQVGPGLEPE